MVSRYPHTAVINWTDEPVKGSDGIYTEGISYSLTVKGRLEPKTSNSEITDQGRVIKAKYQFFGEPTTETIPETAQITISGNTYKIIGLWQYSTHTKIWV
jgi:hypothetical protein